MRIILSFPPIDDGLISTIDRYIKPSDKFGDNGRLLVIGGSKLYVSPIILASKAALYTGIDSLYIAVPEKISPILRILIPYSTVIPLPDMKITKGVARRIIRLIERRKVVVDTVLIGPGLTGIGKEITLLTYKLNKLNLKLVIDSGAIYPDTVKLVKGDNVVYTPKLSELNLMIDEERSFKNSLDEIDYVKEKYNLVIKDYKRFFVCIGGKCYATHEIENPITKYGIFYILSGLIGGLYSVYKDLFKASIISVDILMKTYVNIFEKYHLHYTFDDVIEEVRLLLKRYLKPPS